MGPLRVPGPFALIRLLPGGDLLRTPARFGILAGLGIDLLAALGWTVLLRGRRPSLRRLLLVAAAAYAVLEAWPAGLARLVVPPPDPPPAVHWLAEAPRGPVLELPWNAPGESAPYVYWSTEHWQPMVNGYGSFEPPGCYALGLLGQRFPSGYTARVLRSVGVRYVVVHTDRLGKEARVRALSMTELPEGVALAASPGADLVYEIDPGGPPLKAKEKGPQFD
jgi:hypothetical protein